MVRVDNRFADGEGHMFSFPFEVTSLTRQPNERPRVCPGQRPFSGLDKIHTLCAARRYLPDHDGSILTRVSGARAAPVRCRRPSLTPGHRAGLGGPALAPARGRSRGAVAATVSSGRRRRLAQRPGRRPRRGPRPPANRWPGALDPAPSGSRIAAGAVWSRSRSATGYRRAGVPALGGGRAARQRGAAAYAALVLPWAAAYGLLPAFLSYGGWGGRRRANRRPWSSRSGGRCWASRCTSCWRLPDLVDDNADGLRHLPLRLALRTGARRLLWIYDRP
jgi:hypothetical protein